MRNSFLHQFDLATFPLSFLFEVSTKLQIESQLEECSGAAHNCNCCRHFIHSCLGDKGPYSENRGFSRLSDDPQLTGGSLVETTNRTQDTGRCVPWSWVYCPTPCPILSPGVASQPVLARVTVTPEPPTPTTAPNTNITAVSQSVCGRFLVQLASVWEQVRLAGRMSRYILNSSNFITPTGWSMSELF